MCVLLGGRIAESIIGEITTGASDDYNKLTSYANSYVSTYCFTAKNYIYVNDVKKIGNKLRNIIDDHVNHLIHDIHNFVENILNDNIKYLTMLAEELILKENIKLSDIDNLFDGCNIKNTIDINF
jgi:ATP-dependent Zn protease